MQLAGLLLAKFSWKIKPLQPSLDGGGSLVWMYVWMSQFDFEGKLEKNYIMEIQVQDWKG